MVQNILIQTTTYLLYIYNKHFFLTISDNKPDTSNDKKDDNSSG